MVCLLINMIEDMIFLLVFSHKFNEKWDIGATWVYGTGNALTFPQGVYLGMPQSGGWSDQIFVESVESYGKKKYYKTTFLS